MYSFFPDSTRSWKNIDINFQSSPSIGGTHDPQGVKHLLQLRVGLSPLRHHKKPTISLIHPIIGVIVFVPQETPSTFCYTVYIYIYYPEDTKHFLL